MSIPSKTLTIVYKRVADLEIHLDVYAPPNASSKPLPVVVFFHGGGVIFGDRDSWFPVWIYERAIKAGFVFISADYRLITPSNGHDVVEDIRDLFVYVSKQLNSDLAANKVPASVDSTRIAATGASGGGLCAHLAGIHANPKPKAVLSIYGMGGQMLTPRYLFPKDKDAKYMTWGGLDYLPPSTMSEFLYPASEKLAPVSAAPVEFSAEPSIHPSDNPNHPDAQQVPAGFPKYKRMLVSSLYRQIGIWHDYYTGQHQPSFSEQLRKFIQDKPDATSEELRKVVPANQQGLFPELSNSSSYPPTFLLHGDADTVVPIEESRNLAKLLDSAGVRNICREVPNAVHGFDVFPGVSAPHNDLYDETFKFIEDYLVQP